MFFRKSGSLAAAIVIAASFGCVVPYDGGYSLQPNYPEPAAEPFVMPAGLPKPPDAHILMQQKAAKGGNASLAYETHMSLSEIYDFYLERIAAAGLVNDPNYRTLDEQKNHAMNLCFKWWPGRKALYINAADLAYSSSRDVRMVSVQIQ